MSRETKSYRCVAFSFNFWMEQVAFHYGIFKTFSVNFSFSRDISVNPLSCLWHEINWIWFKLQSQYAVVSTTNYLDIFNESQEIFKRQSVTQSSRNIIDIFLISFIYKQNNNVLYNITGNFVPICCQQRGVGIVLLTRCFQLVAAKVSWWKFVKTFKP